MTRKTRGLTIMSDAHESIEQAETLKETAREDRKVALIIAILALFLSFSETLGKGAQTEAISADVESANLWSFFQAKTVRMTTVRTAAEELKLSALTVADATAKEAMAKQIAAWEKTAARYDSEPDTHEGRKELADRAKEKQEERDVSLAKYHHYEIASAAFQIGIVLCSAAVITSIFALVWFAGVLGAAGVAVLSFGLFAPHLIPLP
jgi:ABC-type nickel/cobalt efflux system permease component RcnA